MTVLGGHGWEASGRGRSFGIGNSTLSRAFTESTYQGHSDPMFPSGRVPVFVSPDLSVVSDPPAHPSEHILSLASGTWTRSLPPLAAPVQAPCWTLFLLMAFVCWTPESSVFGPLFLSSYPKCWDCRCEPPCLAKASNFEIILDSQEVTKLV